MSKLLIVSMLVVTLILGLGVGYMVSPEYAKQSAMHQGSLGGADKEYDLRFINSMIEHHEGAIEMAEDAKMKSDRKEIQDLSDEIIEAQSAEIKMLNEWKQRWYPAK